MIVLRRFLVLAAISAALASPAMAQLSLADLQAKFVGTWLATVEGEAKQRNLIIDTVAQKADGGYLIVGTFTFVGDKPSTFKDGQILQSPDGITLVFMTGAGSLYAVTTKADGTAAGTTKYKSGQVKQVTMVKGAAPAAASASPVPAPAAGQDSVALTKSEVESLVTGKEIHFTMLRNGNDIVWYLQAGGVLNARNSSSGSRDSGEWSLNERGNICLKWRGNSNDGCGNALIRKEGKLYLANPRNNVPYTQAVDIK